MPSPQIRYPSQVFGYSAGSLPAEYGVATEFFETTGAVTKGHAVELDFTSFGRVKTSTTNGAAQLFVGVTTDASTTTGEVVGVVMLGHAVCRVSTTVTAGDKLGASATVAGELAPTAVTTLGAIRAVALESLATNTSSNLRILVSKL